jgi:beta-N-acetylhexosaminidase
MMMDLSGPRLLAEEREMLAHPLVGGVILFTRNFEDPQQLEELVAQIHAVREPRLLVAVDHEGGRVQRFRKGFTRLPAVGHLGQLQDRDPRHAHDLAEVAGWLMAVELRAVDVDLSFAPVLDLARGVSGVIGDRAFHRDPQIAARLGQAYGRGMRMAGMAATGKHFPGHGSVREDSHLTLPVDRRPFADIAAEDLVPFERLIQQGLPAVMTAHVVYPAVDPRPASFSRFWVTEVLRRQLGFQGAVFSDDLSMAGAADIGGFADRAWAALEAGCDMILVCNHPEGIESVLTELAGYSSPASQMRLVRLHGRGHVRPDALLASREWREAVAALAGLERHVDLELNV